MRQQAPPPAVTYARLGEQRARHHPRQPRAAPGPSLPRRPLGYAKLRAATAQAPSPHLESPTTSETKAQQAQQENCQPPAVRFTTEGQALSPSLLPPGATCAAGGRCCQTAGRQPSNNWHHTQSDVGAWARVSDRAAGRLSPDSRFSAALTATFPRCTAAIGVQSCSRNRCFR